MTAPTPHAALVEKVARAIREAPMRATIKGANVIDRTIPLTDGEVLRARTAIAAVREALREPSDKMVQAAIRAFNAVPDDDRRNSKSITAEISAAIAASPLAEDGDA